MDAHDLMHRSMRRPDEASRLVLADFGSGDRCCSLEVIWRLAMTRQTEILRVAETLQNLL